MLYHRIISPSSDLLRAAALTADLVEPLSNDTETAFILTLIECLPYLSPAQLEVWLHLTAKCVFAVSDSIEQRMCRERLWEVLSTEMDVDRSRTCVAWWCTCGGRDAVLGSRDRAGGTQLGRSKL